MKNHLIISLLILSVGFSQQKKSDEPNPMKGVKTQTISNYDYEEKFGEFEEILIDKLIYKYDSNGNMVESSSYDSDGSFISKTTFKYDSKNRIIESISYDLESKFGELQEIPTKKTIYQYEEY